MYFKVFNKDENLGFQDFIIDKMSGKKPVGKPSFVPPPSPERVTPVQVEEKPPLDVLADIAPKNQIETIPMKDVGASFEESETIPASPLAESTTIPDWLKESTSLSSHSLEEDTAPTTEDIPSEEAQETPFIPEELPDTTILVPEEQKIENTEPTEETTVSTDDMSGLPAWMQGVDQESLKQEVAEEISSTPVAPEVEDVSSYENIPDWLKNTSPTPLETTPVLEKKIETEQKQSPAVKKSPKKLVVQEEEKADVSETKEETVPSRPKKKKPAVPTLSS